MSGAPRGRGLITSIFQNIRLSLTKGKNQAPGQEKLMGTDPYGNKYFEVPADPARGKRRPRRWYTALETGQKSIVGKDEWAGYDTEMPSEWESWLRHRRDDAPTDDQVRNSIALGDLKKKNAARLEEERVQELTAEGRYEGPGFKPQDHEKAFFPKYDEYEVVPGEESKMGKAKWADFKNPYMKEEHQNFTKKSK